MNKLKPNIIDKIFNKNKYKEIISLRKQREELISIVENNMIRIVNNDTSELIPQDIFIITMYSLDEISMYNDLGEKAVIDRLKSDVDKLLNYLIKNKVPMGEFISRMREETINEILS